MSGLIEGLYVINEFLDKYVLLGGFGISPQKIYDKVTTGGAESAERALEIERKRQLEAAKYYGTVSNSAKGHALLSSELQLQAKQLRLQVEERSEERRVGKEC